MNKYIMIGAAIYNLEDIRSISQLSENQFKISFFVGMPEVIESYERLEDLIDRLNY